MNSGLYAACAGLRAQTQALDVVANNLANLSTSGFRAQQATFQSLLAGAASADGNFLNHAVNNFGVLEGSRVDLTAGNLQATGNPLDLGIEGAGFFAVRAGQQTLYTRNGSFHLTPDGQLVTVDGYPVLGEQGPVTVPGGTVSISADGTLSVDGAVAGQLRLVEFSPGTGLASQGNSYYSAPQGVAHPANGSAIRQGMLESSNVSAMQAVVDLITVERHAEMLERALGAFDSEFNRSAAEDLPRVQ